MNDLIDLINDFEEVKQLYVAREKEIIVDTNKKDYAPSDIFFKAVIKKHTVVLKNLVDELCDSCAYYVLTKNENPFSRGLVDQLNKKVYIQITDDVLPGNEEKSQDAGVGDGNINESEDEMDDYFLRSVYAIHDRQKYTDGLKRASSDTAVLEKAAKELLTKEEFQLMEKLYLAAEKVNRLYCLMLVKLGTENIIFNGERSSSLIKETAAQSFHLGDPPSVLSLSQNGSEPKDVEEILENLCSLKNANSVDLMSEDVILYNVNLFISKLKRVKYAYLNRVISTDEEIWSTASESSDEVDGLKHCAREEDRDDAFCDCQEDIKQVSTTESLNCNAPQNTIHKSLINVSEPQRQDDEKCAETQRNWLEEAIYEKDRIDPPDPIIVSASDDYYEGETFDYRTCVIS